MRTILIFKIIALYALVSFLFALQACAQAETHFIDQRELEELILAHENLLIIDVREPHERRGPLGKIPQSINISLGALEHGLLSLNPDVDEIIVILCRTDNRSQAAYRMLKAKGFSRLYVLKGGMVDYNHQEPLPSKE